METQESSQERPAEQNKVSIEIANAFYLRGAKLESILSDPETVQAFMKKGKEMKEKKFKTCEELADIVLNSSNSKELFEENGFLLDCAEKGSIVFPGDFIPHGLLLDVKELDKPKLYLIEVMLAKENLEELFNRMTSVFRFFSRPDYTQTYGRTLNEAISKNAGWKRILKPILDRKLQSELILQALSRKPGILLVMDSYREELTGLREAYTETWGKMIKPMFFRKFEFEKEILVTVAPTFEELVRKGKGNVQEKKLKTTEDDHLEVAMDNVREIFLYLKAELLKADATLAFRVKGHYISLRKDRNVALFQFSKWKLCIVIPRPEPGMREGLKHHETRSHAASVKRYWNGNDDCFTIAIEHKEHVDEILNLLKRLVGVAITEKPTDNADDKKAVKKPEEDKVKGKKPAPKAKKGTKKSKVEDKPKKPKKK